MLLSVEATKSSDYVSLDTLLQDSFFSNALGGGAGPEFDGSEEKLKRQLKLSPSSKEALAELKARHQKRLIEDHKNFRLKEKEKRRQLLLRDDNKKKKKQLQTLVICLIFARL